MTAVEHLTDDELSDAVTAVRRRLLEVSDDDQARSQARESLAALWREQERRRTQ